MLTVTQPPDPDEPTADDDLEAQLGRRHEAASRLPPMECGCRDPEAPDHLVGQCRYRPVA